MSQATTAQLQEELAKLRAENGKLARALEQERAGGVAVSADVVASSEKRRRGRGWGRTVIATVLVVLGTLLAPVAVVSTWAQRELTDTAAFVDTFAPLAEDPAVQDFVADQAVSAIEAAVDIDRIADDLFAGLDELELSPRAREALVLLKAPAVSGVRGLLDSTVTEFIRSDAFATIWRDALAITHAQLVNTAGGQADAAVVIGPDQEISLQLGPIIAAVKEQLVAEGFPLAANVPEISRTIAIAQSDSVGLYLAIYQLVVALGIWLPWLSLLLVAAGVTVARRRAQALVWAAGGLLATMLLVGAGIGIGQGFFALAVASTIPRNAAEALYTGILGSVSDIALVVGVLAATVLLITLLSGPWGWARTVRLRGAAAFAGIRRSAERHGISTGATGEWLHRWRLPLRIVIAVGCFAVLVLSRPLATGTIVWTAVVGVLLVAALELLARPSALPRITQEEKA